MMDIVRIPGPDGNEDRGIEVQGGTQGRGIMQTQVSTMPVKNDLCGGVGSHLANKSTICTAGSMISAFNARS